MRGRAASEARSSAGPAFGPRFQAEFESLLAWRRDVRRFRTDAVPDVLIDELIDLTVYAPSVGNCQPTRFVRIDDFSRRNSILANFLRANAEAQATYADERARAYAELKLAGLREAPIQLAIFCDETTKLGHGLGALTMPETRRYSAVCALHTFWLAARARGLGVGWVSILDPATLKETLEVPATWTFIGYFCVGWPETSDLTPELERAGWQSRVGPTLLRR